MNKGRLQLDTWHYLLDGVLFGRAWNGKLYRYMTGAGWTEANES